MASNHCNRVLPETQPLRVLMANAFASHPAQNGADRCFNFIGAPAARSQNTRH